MSTSGGNSSTPPFSIFSPLRKPVFRALWIASVFSNIGTWMHEVGSAWLMTSLTTNPTLIGLLETAITLPMFLFALPGGAIADIVDRRRVLIVTQIWLMVGSAVLAVLTIMDAVTPGVLLSATFLISIGAAVNNPTLQATVPELVGKDLLPSAITLGSVGFNVARALGPALGGLIIATLGTWATFAFDAISFLGVIIVLIFWKREDKESLLPGERVIGAVRAGVRFARHAPALQAVLVRTAVFIVCASAMWATLPLLGRHIMGLNSVQYGFFFGAFGIGAVCGAWVMTRLFHALSTDRMVQLSTLVFAGLLSVLAFVHVFPIILAAMFMGGIAWMILMSSFNTSAQFASPEWVRARTMALYFMVFMGGFAAGAALWGFLTSHIGLQVSLSIAVGGLLLGIPLTRRYRLHGKQPLDLTPSMHWPEPAIAMELHPDDGPVMVTVEYTIPTDRAKAFSEAMESVHQIRKRDGAVHWGLFQDMAEPERFVETYIVESWAEHLRQHERVTVADREIEERARAFHVGSNGPKVAHMIYADGKG